MDWDDIKDWAFGTLIVIVLAILSYSMIGTSGKVATIKDRAPKEMLSRNWEILRYEGFEYGSWGHHGGKVWYHVKDITNPEIQYRVFITLWDNELQYTYGAPEVLHRQDVKI